MPQEIFPNHTPHEIKHDRHTGIALLIRSHIKHTLISKYTNDGHAAITVKIHDKHILPHELHVTSYYVPPHNSRHRTILDTNILRQALQHKYSIITGDFNARHQHLGCTGTNKNGKQLHAFMIDTPNIILNNTQTPTFYHVAHTFADCLDYTIATPSLLPYINACYTNIDIGSDHLPITTIFKAQNKNTTQRTNTHNFNKADWTLFTKSLADHIVSNKNLWPPQDIQTHQHIDQQVEHLTKHYTAVINSTVPKHRTPNNDKPRLPQHVLRLIRSRRHLRNRQKLINTQETRKQINHLNKAIKQEIHHVKLNIQNSKVKIIQQGPRNSQFWRTIKTILKPTEQVTSPITHNNTEISTPKDKADIFAQHFKTIFTETDDIFDVN